MLNRLPFFEKHLQLIGGIILCANKSYKVVKFIYTATDVEGQTRGQESVRAYDSIYSIMNEFGQIVSASFVQGGDYEEMERVLRAIKKSYKVHGFDEVDLFYTDDPKIEYTMLTRAFPELAKNDQVESAQVVVDLPNLPLPEKWERKTICTYE
jgi:hypothetical protein